MNAYRNAYESIVRCVKDLHEIIPELDEDGNLKVPTGLVGLAGEFYCMWLLETKKLNPVLCRGRCDIEIKNENKTIKIEVRSSILKFEGVFKNPKISNWGWRLQGRKSKEDEEGIDIPYNWVICVQFDNNLENPKCFLLSREDVKKMKNVRINRFWKVLKKLWIYKNINDIKIAKKQMPEHVSSFEQEINFNKKKYMFENRWKELV